ncbi:F-box/WD repeat-containing protein 8-like isoform X3 [Dreissena polymorpha]|uniref:F-box/WD repeat-containing protein 8-like isoform X3 n=1 Tax=Dreissena polymorpha TaxID=45954 RepID=UPI002265615A|nr:F-box/WD repeat-containing protein 8-like isoform X3 [Dreissena polymorpha]
MDTEANEQLETFRKQWKKELSRRRKAEKSLSKSLSQVTKVVACKDIPSEVPIFVPCTEAQCAIDNTNRQGTNRCNGNDDLISSCLISVKTSPAVREHLLNFPSASCGNDNCHGNHIIHISSDGSPEIRSPKRHSGAEYTKHKLKRLKHQKLEDIFLERQTSDVPMERLLDRLISDIDEVTEIPFFDITLPKEVAVNIFQYLSMQDLCHCAQNFNGKVSSLEHVKGKILTAVHSFRDTIVAGYTNGDVKLWNLSTDETVLFQPSSTSLLIREENEADSSYVQTNMVHSVQIAGSVTAAVFTHGNIDIWDMQSGSQVLQTHHPKTGHRFIPKMCLTPSSNTIVAGYANYIDILHREGNQTEFEALHVLDTEKDVNHLKLFTNNCDSDSGIPSVVFSTAHTVSVYTLLSRGSGYVGQRSEIHNIFGASIDQVDTKPSEGWLGAALGIGLWGGFSDKLQVKLYDLSSGKLLHSLGGHSWLITCMNMFESPHHELVTGSADRNVRVCDVRAPDPVVMSYFVRAVVSCVQMDQWKVVSGSEDGFVQVWDRRMKSKLWEYNNRHPVRYVHFKDRSLIVGNVSSDLTPQFDDLEIATHRRYRGSVSVYDFLTDLSPREVPEVCLSTYDQPEASRYNIGLAVPYDTLQF